MADDTSPPSTSPPPTSPPEGSPDTGETAPLPSGARDTERQPALDLDEDLPGDTAPLDVDAVYALRALVDEETGTTQSPLGVQGALDDEDETGAGDAPAADESAADAPEPDEDASNPDDTLSDTARNARLSE